LVIIDGMKEHEIKKILNKIIIKEKEVLGKMKRI